MSRRGLLVAFDGVDGSGKTTQIRRLTEALAAEGHDVRVLREPGGTDFGERLRDILLRAECVDSFVETMLFMASRRVLVVQEIAPALAAGEVVLLDRSFLSTLVYQGVVGGVDLELIEALAQAAHAGRWPDRVLLLELTAAEARRRRGERGEPGDGFEARGEAYLDAVAVAYGAVAARLPELVTRIPAGGDEGEVAARCRAAFDEVAGA